MSGYVLAAFARSSWKLCFDEVDALQQGKEGLVYGQIVLDVFQRAEDAFIESRAVLKQEDHP